MPKLMARLDKRTGKLSFEMVGASPGGCVKAAANVLRAAGLEDLGQVTHKTPEQCEAERQTVQSKEVAYE